MPEMQFKAYTAAQEFLKLNPTVDRMHPGVRILARRYLSNKLRDDYRPGHLELMLDHVEALLADYR